MEVLFGVALTDKADIESASPDTDLVAPHATQTGEPPERVPGFSLRTGNRNVVAFTSPHNLGHVARTVRTPL